VPESANHNFLAIEGRTPCEDPNFGFLTVRTSIVYTVCSPRHLCNIREIPSPAELETQLHNTVTSHIDNLCRPLGISAKYDAMKSVSYSGWFTNHAGEIRETVLRARG
jgi:hypothetical protein